MEDKQQTKKVPRLVKMVKTERGYGFNLHGERGVVGQYISAVDDGGPAQKAGLCVGDRVIEVNGINVEAATHAQVVAKIKEGVGETTLLVVDKVTDDYLKQHNIPITMELLENGESNAEDVVAEETTSKVTESESVDEPTVKGEEVETKNGDEVEEVGMSVEEYLKLHGADESGKGEETHAEEKEEATVISAEIKEEGKPMPEEAKKSTPEAEKSTPEEEKSTPEEEKSTPEEEKSTPEEEKSTPEAEQSAPEATKERPEEVKKEEIPTVAVTPVEDEKRQVKMTPPDDPPPAPPSVKAEAAKEPEVGKPEDTAVKEPEKGPEPELQIDQILRKSAALPKPKRKEIKEKKETDWASRNAIFNNL